MKTMILALVAALVIPMAGAAPNVQTGEQSGYYWSEATLVSAQGGTNFVLAGVAGDHDILFLDASGNGVAFYLACGPENGVVPASAVAALVLVWDHDSVPGTCTAAGVAPSSTFIYADGF